MERRHFLSLPLATVPLASTTKRYRVAVIGHTGRGNYGHGIDTVWRAFENMELVAISDADETGRAAAAKRLGVTNTYSDYREMLRKEKPQIVGVAPRWMDQRAAMVTAVADAGAHIYMEKPFALTLADADRMVAAVQRNNVKLQIAHQMRTSPYVIKAKAMIEAGEIGEIQEVRSHGKEDRRAGGEDMMVLGSHLFDMQRYFLGNPEWVVAHVTNEGKEISASDVKQPSEPIGPIAGRQISAMFAYANGVHGFFSSRGAAQTDPLRFGTWIYGSKGVIFLPNAIYPGGGLHLLRAPGWMPSEKVQWESVQAPLDLAGQGMTIRPGPEMANALMVADLVRAIERGGKPCCNEEDGRWTIEMVHSVYQAQKAKNRVKLPMQQRTHPLESMSG